LLGETVFSALIGNVAFYPFVALTIGISATQVLFELQLAVFRSRNQSLQFGIYSFTRFLLIVVLTIILVAGFKLGAQGKLWAEFSVTAVYMLIAIYLLRHDIIINLDFSIAKSIIKYTLPLLPHVLFGALMGLIGKYFINRYLGLEATGIFNIAFLLSSIMSIIVMSINQVWSPYFFKLASENEEEANKIFTKLSTYYFSFVAFIGLLITLFSREFVLLLATPQYASCIEIIPVLTLAAFISGLYFTVSSKVFFVKSAIKIIPITTFLGLIITTVLNWLLIPSYGMMGSAWATVGANLAMLIATYLYSQKFFYMKYEYGRLLKASLSIVVTFLLFIYIQKEIHAPVLLIALKSILCILYFLFLFLFRFLNMSEINWLKKFYNSIKNPQKLSI
jgi:O-antigen/teichoic acid export membrane protein